MIALDSFAASEADSALQERGAWMGCFPSGCPYIQVRTISLQLLDSVLDIQFHGPFGAEGN